MPCEAEFAALQTANAEYVAAKLVCDAKEAARDLALQLYLDCMNQQQSASRKAAASNS